MVRLSHSQQPFKGMYSFQTGFLFALSLLELHFIHYNTNFLNLKEKRMKKKSVDKPITIAESILGPLEEFIIREKGNMTHR